MCAVGLHRRNVTPANMIFMLASIADGGVHVNTVARGGVLERASVDWDLGNGTDETIGGVARLACDYLVTGRRIRASAKRDRRRYTGRTAQARPSQLRDYNCPSRERSALQQAWVGVSFIGRAPRPTPGNPTLGGHHDSRRSPRRRQ